MTPSADSSANILERIASRVQATPDELAAELHSSFGRKAINRFATDLPKSLPSADWHADFLVLLIQTLTALENRYGVCAGSTSVVCHIIGNLKGIDPERALAITDWCFVNATNPYNPMGTKNTNGARSYREYCVAALAHEERREQLHAQQKMQRDSARRARAEQHLERSRTQRARSQTRERLMSRLAALPYQSRIEKILQSSEPICFYPEHVLLDGDLGTLDVTTRQALLARIRSTPSPQWRRFKRALIASLGGYAPGEQSGPR